MPETVSSLVQDAKLVYNDIPLANDPQLGAQTLRILNKIHTDLCEELPIQTTTYNLPLVSGQREYEITEDYKTIYSANYLYSATGQPIWLQEVSVDELDIENPGWRTTFTGVPFRYYDWSDNSSAPIVGFDPIPPTTSSGGYPCVALVVGVRTNLTATSSLPTSIRSSSVYLDGLIYQWAKYKGKPDLQMRKALYDESYQKLVAYFDHKSRRLMPRQSPQVSLGLRSV